MKRLFMASAALLATAFSAYAADPVTPPPDTDPSAAEAPSASSQEQAAEPSATADDAALATIPVDSTAPAKEGAAAVEPAARGGRFVEEILVTAQRREENLADVPVSVQAFSGDKLDALGIDNLDSLQESITSLNVGKSVSFTTIFLRGIGSDAFLTGDPSVAYYIDGIYFPFAFRLSQGFGKVERLEVLKGPQGTTFGRNAVGGAIHVVTQGPQFDEWTGQGQVSFGNYDERTLRLYASGPITETLAVSGALFGEERGQYGDLRLGGERADDNQEVGGRAQLAWAPRDDTDLKLTYFRIDSDSPEGVAIGNRKPSNLCNAIGCTPQQGNDARLSIPIFSETENEVYHGEFTYRTDFADFKLRGSDQFVFQRSRVDYDGTDAGGPVFGTFQIGDFQTAELQTISNKSSWMSSRFDWVGGLYYIKGVTGYKPITFAASSLVDPTNMFGDPSGPGAASDGSAAGIVNTLGAAGIPIPSGIIIQDSLLGTEAYSVYGQLSYDLTEWMELTLGGRYQVEDRDVIRIFTDSLGADGSRTRVRDSSNTATDDQGNTRPAKSTDRSFTPKVSLAFRPFIGSSDGLFAEDSLLFVSYQRATKAATFNAVPVLADPGFVEGEKLDAYEIGFKSSVFDGLLSFDAAAFWYDIRNMQTQLISLLAGGATSLQNIPSARSRGFDLGMTALILPDQINDLSLNLGFGYLDTEYLDFRMAKGYDSDTGMYREDIDATGGRIIYSPETTINLVLSKTWAVPGGTFETSASYYRSADYFLTASNNTTFVENGYHTFGANLSYLYEPFSLRTTLYGENLSDEEYVAGCICNDFGFVANIAPPRTVGVRLAVDF